MELRHSLGIEHHRQLRVQQVQQGGASGQDQSDGSSAVSRAIDNRQNGISAETQENQCRKTEQKSGRGQVQQDSVAAGRIILNMGKGRIDRLGHDPH